MIQFKLQAVKTDLIKRDDAEIILPAFLFFALQESITETSIIYSRAGRRFSELQM